MVGRNSGARDPEAEQETQESITELVLLLLETRGPSTRAELAEQIGIPPASLTHSLSDGKRQREWRVHDLKMLATYYGISTDTFLGDKAAHRALVRELKREAIKRIRSRP